MTGQQTHQEGQGGMMDYTAESLYQLRKLALRRNRVLSKELTGQFFRSNPTLLVGLQRLFEAVKADSKEETP